VIELLVVEEVRTVSVQEHAVDVIETTQSVTVLQEASVGPQGPAGTSVTFEQDFTNQSTIIVNHNLGHKPAVTIIDTTGDECIGDVDHTNSNQFVVTFSAPFSGTILCN
jgi:hypothetical protein